MTAPKEPLRKWAMPTDEESYKLFQRHCSESPVKVGFRNLSASNRWMSEEGDVWRTAWCACRDSIKGFLDEIEKCER